MELPLEIETQDKALGSSVQLTDGIELKYLGPRLAKAVGIPEALHFIVHITENLDLALLTAALYDKFKDKSISRIVVNRRVVTNITKEGIQQVLEEEIRIGKE